jgi:hypothetical protein
MLTFTEAQVLAWITPILWPFLRVLALFGTLPVLAQRSVPIARGAAFWSRSAATLPPIAPIPPTRPRLPSCCGSRHGVSPLRYGRYGGIRHELVAFRWA